MSRATSRDAPWSRSGRARTDSQGSPSSRAFRSEGRRSPVEHPSTPSETSVTHAPRQNSFPSCEPMTTRPEATAGDADSGPPASNSNRLLPLAGVEDVQLAVVRSDVDPPAGNDRRRVDARARREGPRRLAGLAIDGVHQLVPAADDDVRAGERRRRIERKVAVRRACSATGSCAALEVDTQDLVVVGAVVGAARRRSAATRPYRRRTTTFSTSLPSVIRMPRRISSQPVT